MTKGIRSYSPIVQSAWTMHEALRRIGFRADDIYFQIGVDAACMKPSVFVTLKTQDREFRITVAHLDDHSKKEVAEEWRRFILHIDTALADRDAAHEVYEGKLAALGGSVSLVTALLEKGFVLPGKHAS